MYTFNCFVQVVSLYFNILLLISNLETNHKICYTIYKTTQPSFKCNLHIKLIA